MDEICEAVQQMLPWVVNRTATPEQTAEVYLHVANCQECRRQLAQAIVLQRRLREMAEAVPAMPTTGWDRLAAFLAPAEEGLEIVIKRWLPTLEACGLPPVAVELLRLARPLPACRWSVSINIPLWQTVTVRA